MNAKKFLQSDTIPRLAKAMPDFPYFSVAAVRADLKAHNISIKPATLNGYLHDLTQSSAIFDAGRGWYSSIQTPFTLDRQPVGKLVETLKNRFPLLEFSCWSTRQIAGYGHHLLARFVSFVYVDKDAMEGIVQALRDSGSTAYLHPTQAEAAKSFRIDENTTVIRPAVSRGPVDGKYATIEKILVDLYAESAALNLMDMQEFHAIVKNIAGHHRILIGVLEQYAKDRRKMTLDELFGSGTN